MGIKVVAWMNHRSRSMYLYDILLLLEIIKIKLIASTWYEFEFVYVTCTVRNLNCVVTLYFADPESHILFFDIEALIVELLSEEYSTMSPGSLEAAGLISQSEYLKVAALTQSTSSEAHKKIAGKFLFVFHTYKLTALYFRMIYKIVYK